MTQSAEPSTVQPVLVTPALEAMLSFYCGLLGAAETGRVPAEGDPFFVGLRLGSSDLGLVVDSTVVDSTVVDGTVAPPAPARQRVLLTVFVDDVDALMPGVVAHGGRAPAGSNDMPWGHRVAHVRDPDGNALNLTQLL